MSVLEQVNFSRRRRLPMVLASEAAECGLACIAMVARHHGHDVDLNGLRQRFSLSMSGISLRNLMGLADQLGFSTRPLRVELSALRKVRMPAILHWDVNHFVVLNSVSAKGAVICTVSVGAADRRGVERGAIAQVSDDSEPADKGSRDRPRRPIGTVVGHRISENDRSVARHSQSASSRPSGKARLFCVGMNRNCVQQSRFQMCCRSFGKGSGCISK